MSSTFTTTPTSAYPNIITSIYQIHTNSVTSVKPRALRGRTKANLRAYYSFTPYGREIAPLSSWLLNASLRARGKHTKTYKKVPFHTKRWFPTKADSHLIKPTPSPSSQQPLLFRF